MIPLVPVIVSQSAYILYIRALRFADPVQGTAACNGQPAAPASLTRANSRLYGTGLRRFAPSLASLRQDYVAGAQFSVASPRQDYVASLRFPFPSHGLSYAKAKAHPAFAGLLFSYGPLPYESELSTVESHTKKALNVVECLSLV